MDNKLFKQIFRESDEWGYDDSDEILSDDLTDDDFEEDFGGQDWSTDLLNDDDIIADGFWTKTGEREDVEDEQAPWAHDLFISPRGRKASRWDISNNVGTQGVKRGGSLSTDKEHYAGYNGDDASFVGQDYFDDAGLDDDPKHPNAHETTAYDAYKNAFKDDITYSDGPTEASLDARLADDPSDDAEWFD